MGEEKKRTEAKASSSKTRKTSRRNKKKISIQNHFDPPETTKKILTEQGSQKKVDRKDRSRKRILKPRKEKNNKSMGGAPFASQGVEVQALQTRKFSVPTPCPGLIKRDDLTGMKPKWNPLRNLKWGATLFLRTRVIPYTHRTLSGA